MKKVLAMSILTMIVMSMGGCGASSDSSSSQDVSSRRKRKAILHTLLRRISARVRQMIFPFQQAGQMVIHSTVRGAKIT